MLLSNTLLTHADIYIHICTTELLTGLCVDLAEAVVAHLVHETVEEDGRAFPVDPELSSGGVVVVLFDVSARVGAPSDTNHPQKFVDICDSEGWPSNKCNKRSQSEKKNPKGFFYYCQTKGGDLPSEE